LIWDCPVCLTTVCLLSIYASIECTYHCCCKHFMQIKARLAKTSKEATSNTAGSSRSQKRASPVCVIHHDFSVPGKPVAVPTICLPRPASQSSLDGVNQVIFAFFMITPISVNNCAMYLCNMYELYNISCSMKKWFNKWSAYCQYTISILSSQNWKCKFILLAILHVYDH